MKESTNETPALRLVRATIKKDPARPARTIARELYAKHPEMWKSVEACRSMVRYALGVNGKENRGLKVVQKYSRERRNPGDDWTQYLPDSWDESDDWKPLKVKGPMRCLFICDTQVPFQVNDVIKLAVNYGLDRGADTVYMNGDMVDHYSISDYVKDPRLRDFPEEVRLGRLFLKSLRVAFPDARIVYKHGNHEERFERFMRIKAPELLGIPEFTWDNAYGVGDLGIEVVKKKQPVHLGSLRAIHGHELRISGVQPARSLFLKSGVNSICGDVHRTHHFSEPNMDGQLISSWTVGCLCGLHPDFLPMNKWNHGFAFVEVDADGAFRVENLRVVDGRAW